MKLNAIKTVSASCLARIVTKYRRDEDGLVTLEWVGIAAVLVVAAILISNYIMGGADNFAGAVVGNLDAAATNLQ